MKYMIGVLSILVGLAFVTPVTRSASPVTFTVNADWQLTQAEKSWLLNSYIPSRWTFEQSVITWVNNQPAPACDGLTVNVYLHPGLFESPTGAGIVAGQMVYPAYGLTYEVHVDWDYEMNRGQIVMSHEFGHLQQLMSGAAGWPEIGHGTPGDPVLQKLIAIASQVYMPGHVYDPFKPTVY